jgi:uncharacterized protein (UPF0332 family)
MNPDRLFAQARMLADSGRKPHDSDLKRAISTTYYAVFHCLAALCANAVVGRRKSRAAAWRLAYRAIEHGKAKTDCMRFAKDNQGLGDRSVSVLRELSIIFVELQDERHKADYDPRPCDISQLGVLAIIKRSEAVVDEIGNLKLEQVLDFPAHIIFKERK